MSESTPSDSSLPSPYTLPPAVPSTSVGTDATTDPQLLLDLQTAVQAATGATSAAQDGDVVVDPAAPDAQKKEKKRKAPEIGEDGKPKKKRSRQVLSCVACVRRKTKCQAGVTPCESCVKRGEAEQCYIEGQDVTATKQPFALNEEFIALRERVVLLERLVGDLTAARNGTGTSIAEQQS